MGPSASVPLKVLAAAWATVRTESAVPLLVIVPAAPLRLLIVGLKEARSTTPAAAVKTPVPRAALLPTCSVPPVTVVPPV